MPDTLDPTKLDLHIGKQIRWRRRLIGMTQLQLAKKIKLNKMHGDRRIQKYEAAGARVSAANLYLIAKALEVPVNFFYEGFSE